MKWYRISEDDLKLIETKKAAIISTINIIDLEFIIKKVRQQPLDEPLPDNKNEVTDYIYPKVEPTVKENLTVEIEKWEWYKATTSGFPEDLIIFRGHTKHIGNVLNDVLKELACYKKLESEQRQIIFKQEKELAKAKAECERLKTVTVEVTRDNMLGIPTSVVIKQGEPK